MLGNQIAHSFLQREIQLRYLRQSFSLLQSEICYALTVLPQAMQRVAENTREPVKGLFTQTVYYLEQRCSGSEAWEKALIHTRPLFCLQQRDQEIIEQVGVSLGSLDRENQLKQLLLTEEYLAREEEEAKKEGEKKAYLWRYFGTAFGILLIILFY